MLFGMPSENALQTGQKAAAQEYRGGARPAPLRHAPTRLVGESDQGCCESTRSAIQPRRRIEVLAEVLALVVRAAKADVVEAHAGFEGGAEGAAQLGGIVAAPTAAALHMPRSPLRALWIRAWRI